VGCCCCLQLQGQALTGSCSLFQVRPLELTNTTNHSDTPDPFCIERGSYTPWGPWQGGPVRLDRLCDAYAQFTLAPGACSRCAPLSYPALRATYIHLIHPFDTLYSSA
jgi:hypothetical protein